MPRISIDNYDTVASWNGSQDLFVVEQTDGTKVATPEQIKQYVLNDMDEVPTQDSNDTVKSGGVFSAVKDVYSVMGQMGAKNLIPYPFYEKTKTVNGITFTDNGDGTITVDTAGSASTGNATFSCQSTNALSSLIKLDKNKTYIFSDPTHSGVVNNYVAAIRYFAEGVTPSTSTGTAESCKESNNWQVTITNAVYATIYLYVWSGQTVSNLTFKPMLRFASDTDNTYQPYAKTNKQLTEVIGDLSQTGLTGDSVAEQLGDVKEQIDDLKDVEIYEGNLNYSGKYKAYKYGRVVSLIISGVVNPNTSQQMILTESFPTAIRPMVDVNVVGMYGEGGFNASATSVNYRIEANGKIWTYAYQAFTSGTASITYMSAM